MSKIFTIGNLRRAKWIQNLTGLVLETGSIKNFIEPVSYRKHVLKDICLKETKQHKNRRISSDSTEWNFGMQICYLGNFVIKGTTYDILKVGQFFTL